MGKILDIILGRKPERKEVVVTRKTQKLMTMMERKPATLLKFVEDESGCLWHVYVDEPIEKIKEMKPQELSEEVHALEWVLGGGIIGNYALKRRPTTWFDPEDSVYPIKQKKEEM